MTVLTFVLTLHTPVRVGSAYARDGVDAAIDHDDPLPADHLKGVMWDAATRLLGRAHPLVAAVFGTSAKPSPWAWTSGVANGAGWMVDRRHRVAISPDTHSALKDMLVLGEHAWANAPRFEVHRSARILGAHSESDHVIMLRVAAAGVHDLGSWRRRGLGWVGLTPEAGPVTDREIRHVLAWREADG